MNVCDEVVGAVSRCRKCELRQLFTTGYKDSIKYHSFCFYYSHEDAKKSKFVMVMQNPGLPRQWRESDEYEQMSMANKNSFVGLMQKYLIQWLTDNRRFAEGFFKALSENKLIHYGNLEEYLEKQFLSDFLVTDLVKCRAETEKLKKEHIKTCAELYLSRELQNYGRGKLIFAISSRTWEFLGTEFNAKQVRLRFVGEAHDDDQKVAKAHGKLFRSEALNSYFIPLAHFSQRQFNNYLRDSYFEYLKDGLKEYAAELNSAVPS
ncbi:MAG: hypothetical protein HY679_10960 [Chloroflexi bacterium]|nr:hypothetical protein [Chloroflexota bacterium]